MLIRLPKQGAGVEGDPFTVMMPTWRWITDTPNGQAMIVSIPDADAPDDTDAPNTGRFPNVNGVPVLVGLTIAQRVRWHIKLARRWGTIMQPPTPDPV